MFGAGYRAAMDACVKCGRWEGAQLLFEEMRQQGGPLTPGVKNYSILISAFGRQGMWERAMQMMDLMEKDGCEPNCVTYNALISACEKGQQVDEAFRLFRRMKQQHITPDYITYSALISACEKCGGQIERAWMVLQEMLEQGITPNVITYTSLISACGKSGDLKRAFEIYQTMLDRNLTPNVVTYSALISACGKAGQLSQAFQVLQTMLDKGMTPNVITCSALISACERAGEWKVALEVLDLSVKSGLASNVIAYSAVISACAKGAQWEKAFKVYEQMRKDRLLANTITYTALLHACETCRQWEKAMEVYREICDRKDIKLGYAIFNNLLGTLWMSGQFELGFAELKKALDAKIYPHDKDPLGCLISNGNCLALDLHFYTYGSAVARTVLWLCDLHQELQRGYNFPPQLAIMTGWGKHSPTTGSSTVKDILAVFLSELNAPFRISEENKGIFVADTDVALAWLQDVGIKGSPKSDDLCALLCKASVSPSIINRIEAFTGKQVAIITESQTALIPFK